MKLDYSTLHPKYDGITHINVSYLATTELGKLLNDSSDLLVEHTPTFNNPNKKTYYFSGYAWFAYCMTGTDGNRNLVLAGSTPEFVRQYLQENTLIWSKSNIANYKYGLKKRIERADVFKLLGENHLPIVSYIMVNNKYQFRSNDKFLVREYNNISELMSGRKTLV